MVKLSTKIIIALVFIFPLFPIFANASVVEQNLVYNSPNWTWTARSNQEFNAWTLYHVSGSAITPVSCNQSFPYLSSPNNFIGNDTDHTGSGIMFNCFTTGTDWTAWNNNVYEIQTYNFSVGTSTGNYDVSYFQIVGGEIQQYGGSPESTKTRIIYLSPEDESVLPTNDVEFNLSLYINPDDLGFFRKIKITLHNIDQNVLFGSLVSFLNPNDIYLMDEFASTTGSVDYSFNEVLGDGNYRIKACLERFYLYYLNPVYSPVDDCVSHQFIVGTSTFIGNISQTIFGETNDFFEGLTATSSEALASTCNPLNSNFGIRECMAYMFIPDGESLNLTMENAKTGFLGRMPWGYVTRFFAILNSEPTTTLPAFSVNLPVGGEYMNFSIDAVEILEQTQALMETDIVDPLYNKTIRDVLEDILRLCVASAVVGGIIFDVLHSRGGGHSSPKNST